MKQFYVKSCKSLIKIFHVARTYVTRLSCSMFDSLFPYHSIILASHFELFYLSHYSVTYHIDVHEFFSYWKNNPLTQLRYSYIYQLFKPRKLT